MSEVGLNLTPREHLFPLFGWQNSHSLIPNYRKILFWKLFKNSSPPCLTFIILYVHMQHPTDRISVSLTAAQGEMREAPCTRRGQWMTTHFVANKTAGHQWAIPGWLKVRHSHTLKAFICLLHCKEISYVPVVSPISLTGHAFTLPYVFPRHNWSTFFVHFSR